MLCKRAASHPTSRFDMLRVTACPSAVRPSSQATSTELPYLCTYRETYRLPGDRSTKGSHCRGTSDRSSFHQSPAHKVVVVQPYSRPSRLGSKYYRCAVLAGCGARPPGPLSTYRPDRLAPASGRAAERGVLG